MMRTADRFDRANETDRRFFRRFPNRSYRLRRLEPVEIEHLGIVADLEPLPPGRVWFTVMRQLAPGLRCRVFRNGPVEHSGDEAPEHVAKAIYDQHCEEHPRVRAREADILAAARRPGGPLHDGGGAR